MILLRLSSCKPITDLLQQHNKADSTLSKHILWAARLDASECCVICDRQRELSA